VRSWVEASGGGGYAKLTESGTNDGTLTLYDDTASTGNSLLRVKAGAAQTDASGAYLLDMRDEADALLGGFRRTTGGLEARSGVFMVMNDRARLDVDEFALRAALHIRWADGFVEYGTKDVGLVRDAAGVLRVSDGDTGTGGIGLSNAVTNAVTDALKLRHESTGTPAAGFGTGLCFQGESSTTSNQDMARIASVWSTATHASRSADLTFSTVAAAGSLTERMRLKSDGRLMVTTPNAAPTDADIAASQVTLYLDETANKLHFRVKYADGTTLKTGEVALA
jgi:hypothetical protein